MPHTDTNIEKKYFAFLTFVYLFITKRDPPEKHRNKFLVGRINSGNLFHTMSKSHNSQAPEV